MGGPGALIRKLVQGDGVCNQGRDKRDRSMVVAAIGVKMCRWLFFSCVVLFTILLTVLFMVLFLVRFVNFLGGGNAD